MKNKLMCKNVEHNREYLRGPQSRPPAFLTHLPLWPSTAGGWAPQGPAVPAGILGLTCTSERGGANSRIDILDLTLETHDKFIPFFFKQWRTYQDILVPLLYHRTVGGQECLFLHLQVQDAVKVKMCEKGFHYERLIWWWTIKAHVRLSPLNGRCLLEILVWLLRWKVTATLGSLSWPQGLGNVLNDS